LKLKLLTGKVVSVAYEPEQTVIEFKDNVKETTGIPVENQRIILAGKLLDDERKLSSYGVKEGFSSVMHLVVRFRGGR
jgi:hypothetical protein